MIPIYFCFLGFNSEHEPESRREGRVREGHLRPAVRTHRQEDQRRNPPAGEQQVQLKRGKVRNRSPRYLRI